MDDLYLVYGRNDDGSWHCYFAGRANKAMLLEWFLAATVPTLTLVSWAPREPICRVPKWNRNRA